MKESVSIDGGGAPPRWVTRCAVHSLMFLLFVMPLWLRRFIAVLVGPCLLLVHAKRRHIIDVNLRYCMPQLTARVRQQLALGLARRFLFALLDTGGLWFGSGKSIARSVRIIGEEHLHAARCAQQAVILLTPHTVGIEYAGIALASRHPMIALTSRGSGRLGAWAMGVIRGRHARKVFIRSSSMLQLVRELRAGRVLYYLPDEDLGERARSLFVPYFGRCVNAALGSGRLVALADAQVLPCVTTLDTASGVYTVRIEPPIAGLSGCEPAEVCARLRMELERLIGMAPNDYLWSQRIFQTREDGSRNPDYGRPYISHRKSTEAHRKRWLRDSA